MRGLWSDTRHGLRVLLRNPGASALAMLCLGLGIGLETTMFAGADPWLFRPLPYDAPERLAGMREVDPRGTQRLVSTPTYVLVEEQSRTLAAAGAVVRVGRNLSTDVEPERIPAAEVTASLFPMLGAAPVEGRLFTAEEDRPGGPPVCLIGDDLWKRRFEGRPGVVGRTIRIDGEVHTIVGRMRPGWAFPENAELWTPLRLDRGDRDHARRGLDVTIRLREGETIETARRELDALARRAAAEHPDTNEGWGYFVQPLLEQYSPPGVRAALRIMLAAAAFVLLIACANVANLLLAQGIERRREVATRLALGAGAGSLLRERLLESLLLATGAGAIGILLARWGTVILAGAVPVGRPFWATMALNPRVLAVTLASCALASVAAGLLPALEAAHLDVRGALSEGGRGSSAGARSRRLGNALVAAELAAAVILLSSALLMVRSFRERQRFDAGFKAEGALSARLTLTGDAYREPSQRAVFLDEVLRRARSLPGVEAATVLTSLPFSDEFGGGWSADTIEVDGLATPSAALPSILVQGATAEAFAALGVAIRAGRGLHESEIAEGADVAVVSDGAVRRLWPGQEPLGRRFRLGDGEWLRVVGIATEIREPSSILGLDIKPPGQVWLPYLRRPSSTVTLVARGRDPEALASLLRQEIHAVDPHLPLYQVRTLAQARRRADWVAHLWGQMLTTSAVIGALLACVGVYGVVARNVARRTHEIGVRMAMGADAQAVLGFVLGQGLVLALVGVGAGTVFALVSNRALAGLLYGVSAADPLTLLGSAIVLFAVALLATYVPARRATTVNLVAALRAE